MKVKMCLAKIATSLLSILDFVIITVLIVCAIEKLPLPIAALLMFSWCFWMYCIFLLPFGLLISEAVFVLYSYSVLCLLRLVYNVLLVLFLAVLAVFVPRASQAKALSDVMSMLTGSLFDNALASMEIRLTAYNAGQVIGWTLLALLCYSMCLAAQLALLLLCAKSNSSSKSTDPTDTSTITTAAKADKKKSGGDAKNALLDV